MLLRSSPAPSDWPSLLETAVPGDEPSPVRRRTLRKRWAFGLGLSLAAHLLAVSTVVMKARHDWVATGEGGDLGVDMVRVDPIEEPLPADPLPRATDSALPARAADTVARPARRAGSPGRPLRVAGAPTLAPPIAPPLERPAQLTPPPTVDPAAEATRAAFRATLRRHLYQAWRAGEVYQRIDPRGQMAGSLFTTAVQVRFRPDGRIEKAELRESSGIAALDKEALGALERLEPLPSVPAAMLDAQGGWPVLCKFYLDVGMFRFAALIRRALTDKWQPSRAFAMTSEVERRTVVRFLLKPDGSLVSATVVQGSGLQLLDDNALSAVAPGAQLPAPPPGLIPKNGPAQVFVAFLHQAGDVRVMKPREDVEDE